MSKTGGCCKSFLHFLFDYETNKTLVITSLGVGCFFRLSQLAVLLYAVGYVLMVQKAYQQTDTVMSTITTKVKGFAFTNRSDMDPHFWDVADYVIPPQGGDSFFVLTNMVITPHQTQSRCLELPGPSATCVDDCDCIEGYNDPRGNGIRTGLCENYSTTARTCEVLSWLIHVKSRFNMTRNILPHINSSYLKRCIFNRTTDPDCPIFRLKHIISEAGEDFEDMAVKGGILGIIIDWSCDLDWWAGKCFPKYSFRRLDNKNPTNNVAPGYNFRFAKYFKTPDGAETRTLIKAYGIRFDILVFGTAGKFGIVPMIVSLGAGLSFLTLVPLVADVFMLTCARKRHLYNKHKVTYLNEDEDTEPMSMATSYGTQ
uniref:P2X purinoceptor n=1 Tax=Labrus bergylta TaxID=56723 RepID=A0A3Q3E3S7_9LABR